MRNTLSSSQTFISKYVFPVLWSSMFGLGTLGLWLGIFHDKSGGGPVEWLRWLFLGVWIVGTAFVIWHSRRIKRVQVDEHSLYISNYFSEVMVPLTEVANLTESMLSRPKTITIEFHGPTAAGSRVVFIPKFRLFSFGTHPVIAELRALCEKASGPKGDGHRI